MTTATVLSKRVRVTLAGVFVFWALLMFAGAVLIPFVYESPSMFYKFGFHKALLRTGKVLGGIAVLLALLQILLVSRFKIADRVWGADRLYNLHRLNGITLAATVLLHPLLVVAAEDFTFFPLEIRYGPEFIGIGALALGLVLAATAQWRARLHWAYHQWLRFHRWGAPLFLSFITVHVLFVSETYASGPPRVAVLLIAGLLVLMLSKHRLRMFFLKRNPYYVRKVVKVSQDAFAIDIAPSDGDLDYLPGQFAFITPVSRKASQEEHPFTICSTPSQPGSLQFIIRSLGDWTSTIKRLDPDDRVFVDGPYGRFSHLILPDDAAIIMIAGGIGITPMLSMLRYMADVKDRRPILLIWSNRGPETVVFAEEIETLQQNLQQFEIIKIMTRAPQEGRYPARLNRQRLARLLQGWSRQTDIFLCGPPGMVRDMGRALQQMGFSPARVYKETFQL